MAKPICTPAQSKKSIEMLLNNVAHTFAFASREKDPKQRAAGFSMAALDAVAAAFVSTNPADRKAILTTACSNFVLAGTPLDVWRPFFVMAALSKAPVEAQVQDTLRGIEEAIQTGEIGNGPTRSFSADRDGETSVTP